MRIMKFGGKSLGSHEKMFNICKFIKKAYKNDNELIVVVSAMGKSTDELVHLANEFGNGKLSKRELAVLLSCGETQSSALLSIMLEGMGVPAKSFQGYQLGIRTFGGYDNGRIAYINKTALKRCLDEKIVAVVSGFQGINRNEEITTLGRGGSDTTAAAIGAIFEKDVEIYSDFDGVFAGDPRDLNFKKLKNIDFNSMISMSNGGAKVIDTRASELAKNFDIKLISKSSSEPEKQGTTISSLEYDVVSLSTIDHLSQVTITISNTERFEKVLNNVIFCLKKVKFYNFSAKPKKITFLINSCDRTEIINKLANKLNLVKKRS